MKISNVTIVSTDLTNNTVKISFTISETTENVNIYLKINDEEYKEIFSNKTNETLEYTANVSRGVNNLLLKATDSTTEYISEPIQVLLKEAPSIKNLKCSYSDSTGKYILNFAFNGDSNFKYNIYLKLDTNDYIEVLSNQISGDKTIEQTSTMGEHTCVLKVSDGYNDYTFSPFQFEITNHKPILSKVLVTDITNNGEAYIYYSTKDIESSTLTHKLTIGTTETVITPTQVDNFYSYKVTGLSEGTSNCMISISDDIDTVSSDIFSIEVFSNTTDKKELLRRAKVRYDSAYQQLRDIIVSVISDLKYDYDVENALIAKAQDNYKIEYSNFNKISQQSIDTIGTNKVNVTRQDLEIQINDVDNAVDTLETTMNGVFKDGILDKSEKRILEENLNIVAKEKIDVDRDYKTLYDNEDLLDPAKTKLQTKYNNFATAHTTLVTTVNGIINKAGIIDNTDKTNIDIAFENWRTTLGDYRNASLEAIDSIAKKKADDSADVIDKKWAEIILNPDTGIKMQVGNLTNKVNNVTTKVDGSVKDVQVMYYLSTSETVLEGGEWSDVAPQWEKDKYMWSKTVTTLTNGTVNESNPTCIAGAKGESAYTWIKYADDENGTNMSNDPTDKSYIGFAYNKTTPTESDDASEYIWSLIKGRDGIDGKDGKDGTSVTILGSYDTLEELNNAHPNGNNNGDGYIIAGDLYVWQGTEFINVGKIKGEDGIDGKTPYMHIKYSNDGGLTFTPSNGEEAGDYIGLYTDFIEADSTDVTKYTWTKIKGYDGINAVTYYTWIKYSDNANGSNMYDTPTDSTKYIGIATNKTTKTESTNPTEYTWSKFRGEDGTDGVPGSNGTTYYTWIKYANDSNGNGMSNSPIDKAYIGFAYNKTTPIESNNATDYKWSLIKGADGINGTDGTNGVDGIDGKDGVTYYTWIKYSDNADGTGLYDVPNENTKYIGIAVNQTIQTESTDKTKYIWSKFRGEDGVDGVDGVPGTNGVDGVTYYTWIKYADDSNGNGLSNDPTNKDYIGFAYNKTTSDESTNPTDYTWSLIKGTDGVDGTNGVDGITYYTWIKYSDNADGTGLYDIPNSNTKYIGIATNKPTATESTNKTDYVWSLFKGEDGISGTDGIGINNIVEEYYLSTSKETQEGGEWVETPPTWEVGKYMWTRSRIEYSNGTIEYTTPICDSSWEAANNVTTELQEIDKRIAKIEVDSDSITSTVSHITNKVDNMTIGTRNYVLNSAFNNDTKGWTFHDNCYIDKTKTLNNYPSCKSEQSGLTADSWRGCRNFSLPTRNNLGIKEGETWTFSCWYYVENKTTFDSGLVLEIKGKPSGSTNDNTLANVPVSKDNIIEGKWTRLVKTFTANKDYDECYIYAYVIRNGTVWFTCFQLEKSTVVSDWNPAPEDDSTRLTTAESTITQLSNSITSMVTENDVHSIIQQTPSDVQIGFNGISNNVVINSSGLTVNQGYIACDTLTTPAGHQPVINLFQKTVNNKLINCQIDARISDGGDYGGAIRLKYDSNSYLMVNDSGVFFFIEGEQAFSFVSDGSTYGAISINASNIGYLEMGASWIAYNNKGLAFDDHIHEIYSLTTHNHDGKYASSSHTHNYASSSHTHHSIQSSSSSSYQVSTYSGSTGGEVSLKAGGATVYLSNYSAFSLYPSSSNIDLGLSNNRWRYIYSQNALNTSDKKYKENIIYIDELLNNETMTLSLDNNTQQETLFLDFIKNDFRPALYNYISESGEEQLADEQIGFIANDIIDTEVGKTFLYDYGTNGESEIMFSPIGYTTVIGRALQEEILVRENKIAELENRIAELENKLNQ